VNGHIPRTSTKVIKNLQTYKFTVSFKIFEKNKNKKRKKWLCIWHSRSGGMMNFPSKKSTPPKIYYSQVQKKQENVPRNPL
jgi:hypothetical protein